ncbi:MAG: molybdate ABC transporter substrate-binding protein [Candidatus Glassbacteria bacterium]
MIAVLIGLAIAGRRSRAENQRAEKEIVVYAAASLTEAMEAAGKAFTAKTGTKVGFEFGSSGSLARKIEAGSPTDVFISADEKWIAYADEKKLLDHDNRLMFARNRLVCIVSATNKKVPGSAAGLPGLERISVGDPGHVPAGQYAKEALTFYGLWDSLLAKEKIVFAMDVRAATAYVEQGEVQAGIVYSTDAKVSRKVKVAFEFPEESHTPVTYHAGVVSRSGNKAEAAAFIKFLGSDEFRRILAEHGFSAP